MKSASSASCSSSESKDLVKRLHLAQSLLKKADEQLEHANDVKSRSAQQVVELRSLIVSRLDPQRFDVHNLQKSFGHFQSHMTKQLSDVGRSFKEYDRKWVKQLEQYRYKMKLLRDQLNVKRLRLKDITIKHDALMKESTNSKLSSVRQRCMRCKARKAVIQSLEKDIIDRSAEMKKTQDSNARLNSDVSRLKEAVGNQNREIVELKARLQDEMNKNTARMFEKNLAPSTAKNADRSLTIVHMSGGEKSSSAENSLTFNYNYNQMTPNPNDHSRCEKESIRLQWILTNKSAELRRTQTQLQEARNEVDARQVQLTSLSRQFKMCIEERKTSEMKCQKLAEAAIDTEKRFLEAKEKLAMAEATVQELSARNETLQTLLANLATSVQSMLTT